MMKRLISINVAMVLILITVALCLRDFAVAQEKVDANSNAVELLSGFDLQRLESVYPPSDATAIGELAKLVYRLQSVDESSLAARVPKAGAKGLGQAMSIDGPIRSMEFIDVPEKLIEFLEFKRLRSLVVENSDGEVRVVTANLAADAAVGDQVRGVGVVIESDNDRAIAVGTARLGWIPSRPASPGWKLLADAGVDIGTLADVSTRNRKPLMSSDADAFYAMMAASAAVASKTDLPTASSVDAIKLLTDAKSMVGQWIRMEVETVQVTRVSITEPKRKTQLGRDHYFQIDAIADLGNAVIKIERSDDGDGPAATFEDRYPISIVTTELPKFLNDTIWKQSGPNAVVTEVSRQVTVEGFFYRLWSYQTEYMRKFGGEDQFGPLVIAAKINDAALTSSDPVGVAMIGWIATFGIFAGLVATFAWHRYTTAGDREVSKKRKQREAEDIEFK